MFQMQEVVDVWKGLVQAMRGTLVLAKTFWYFIDFTCQDEELAYATIGEITGSLKMKSYDGVINEVESLEPDCVRQLLGARQCPTNNEVEKENLQEVAKN